MSGAPFVGVEAERVISGRFGQLSSHLLGRLHVSNGIVEGSRARGQGRREASLRAERPLASDHGSTMPAMPLGDLTQAWVAASAALPVEWVLVGVWLDPDRPGEWQAVARGPGVPPETVTGRGSHTGLALNDLARRLRERRGSASG